MNGAAMSNNPYPPDGTDTVLAAPPFIEDDATISWSREPADGEDPDAAGEVGSGAVDRSGNAEPAEPAEPAALAEFAQPDGAAQPVEPPEPDGAAAASAAGLWSDVGAQAFRGRWREVQLRFVDDPPAAVREAEALVTDATDELAAVIAAQRDALAGWRSGEGGDTEDLRVAIRRYRDFLDRVLDL